MANFLIAGWRIEVLPVDISSKVLSALLPSFAPFLIGEDSDAPLLFRLTIDNSMPTDIADDAQRIRTFDTGNGDIDVDRMPDGGYRYLVHDISHQPSVLLQCNASFSECRCSLMGDDDCQCFGLNNAMMLCYAFAGSFHKTLLIHASLVRHEGRGYAFIAKSGTGKSTQVANWLRMIPNCDLMNDDNPVIRIIDGKAFIYGSPWSGKTPCYRRVSAPLGAITRIDRQKENSVERMMPVQAFGSVLPSCSSMKWEKALYSHICDTVTDIVATTPIYTLHCTADPESAIVCHETIHKKNTQETPAP